MYWTQNTFRFGLVVFEWLEQTSSAHTIGLWVWADWELPSCFFPSLQLTGFLRLVRHQSDAFYLRGSSQNMFLLSSTAKQGLPIEDQFNNQTEWVFF